MGSAESNPEVQGWRILEVIPNGPCWDKGLCVYFDFIVGINGVRLTTSSEEFWDTIRSQKDAETVLTVFNYKTRIKRDILMTPNNSWGGDGLLGLVVVGDDFTKCDQQCVRVLRVHEGSPASKAGLCPETDYILGTPISAFTEFSIFRDTVADYLDQALPIYVYSSKEATVRLVEIMPSSQWPGEGVLGCITGDGYLHHIPSLDDHQETISFVPNSCYVISSKSPQQITDEQQTMEQFAGASALEQATDSGQQRPPAPEDQAVAHSLNERVPEDQEEITERVQRRANGVAVDAVRSDGVPTNLGPTEPNHNGPPAEQLTVGGGGGGGSDAVEAVPGPPVPSELIEHREQRGPNVTSYPPVSAPQRDLLNQLDAETQQALAQQ